MSIQLTIIGLDKIGVSLGLALQKQTEKITRVGHDRKSEIHKKAQEINAIDEAPGKILKAVENADIVLLSLPIDEIEDTISVIAPALKPGAVLLDTSPLKIQVSEWVKQYLPEDRYFVTFHPTLNPKYLHENSTDTEFAHDDLFYNSNIIISSDPSTDGDAVKLATDLARLIGSKPFFADPYEVDGLVAATEILPRLTAAAYLHAVMKQPGWKEAQKVAGTSFKLMADEANRQLEREYFGTGVLSNKENSIRTINNMMIALHDLRTIIESDDEEGLKNWYEYAIDQSKSWEKERFKADWDNLEDYSNLPTTGDFFARMLGFKKRKPKKS
jgi:prephenate dehydrogenase